VLLGTTPSPQHLTVYKAAFINRCLNHFIWSVCSILIDCSHTQYIFCIVRVYFTGLILFNCVCLCCIYNLTCKWRVLNRGILIGLIDWFMLAVWRQGGADPPDRILVAPKKVKRNGEMVKKIANYICRKKEWIWARVWWFVEVQGLFLITTSCLITSGCYRGSSHSCSIDPPHFLTGWHKRSINHVHVLVALGWVCVYAESSFLQWLSRLFILPTFTWL